MTRLRGLDQKSTLRVSWLLWVSLGQQRGTFVCGGKEGAEHWDLPSSKSGTSPAPLCNKVV